MNIDTACASFITSMIEGTALIKAGFYKTVLIVSIANWATRIIDLSTKSGRIIGDGVGAVILSHVNNKVVHISAQLGRVMGDITIQGIELSNPAPIKRTKKVPWEPSCLKNSILNSMKMT